MHYSYAIAEVVRNEFVESLHTAVACVRTADGDTLLSVGDPARPAFPRSSLKPLQALAPISAGVGPRFGLTQNELAIFCGSHIGESVHVEAVQSILRKVGIEEAALQCGSHWPCEATSDDLRSRGEGPRAVHNNCSGKHAGMLACCVAQDLPVETYLEVEQRNQQQNINNLAAMSSTPRDEVIVGIDGCAAPTFGLPIRNMALAFARLGAPEHAPEHLRDACRAVTAAMTVHPRMVAGAGQSCTRLMEATAGALVVKSGAEAFYAAAIPGRGLGIAVKVIDGGFRAAVPIALQCLRQIGAMTPELPAGLEDLWTPPLYNCRNDRVGEIRAQLVK